VHRHRQSALGLSPRKGCRNRSKPVFRDLESMFNPRALFRARAVHAWPCVQYLSASLIGAATFSAPVSRAAPVSSSIKVPAGSMIDLSIHHARGEGPRRGSIFRSPRSLMNRREPNRESRKTRRGFPPRGRASPRETLD